MFLDIEDKKEFLDELVKSTVYFIRENKGHLHKAFPSQMRDAYDPKLTLHLQNLKFLQDYEIAFIAKSSKPAILLQVIDLVNLARDNITRQTEDYRSPFTDVAILGDFRKSARMMPVVYHGQNYHISFEDSAADGSIQRILYHVPETPVVFHCDFDRKPKLIKRRSVYKGVQFV